MYFVGCLQSITPLRKYIAIGYAVIALLIGGIVFIYLHEWRELELIEAESEEVFFDIPETKEEYRIIHVSLYSY